jgi:hypothetical protein
MAITTEAVRSHVVVDPPDTLSTDIAIVGSGMGGGTLSFALKDTGARVLLIEQGDFLPAERENWSIEAVHLDQRYKNSASWYDPATGKSFVPGNYHYVGGNTKLYGATLPRFRAHDFEPIEHVDGVSPGWPLTYADLEPYYGEVEQMFWVHGNKGEDPTDPWRSTDYPFPGISHEGATARLATTAKTLGLHPFSAPQAVDWRDGGACVLCDTCDSFPCMVGAKGDADTCAVRPALLSGNVRLLTNAQAIRLDTDTTGRHVTSAQVTCGGRRIRVRPSVCPRLWRGQHRGLAPAFSIVGPPTRPCQFVGSGRTKLHVASDHVLGRCRSAPKKRRGVSENTWRQRLVQRRTDHQIPLGKHSGLGQIAWSSSQAGAAARTAGAAG